MELISVVVLIVIGAAAIAVIANKARRKRLIEKYGDAQVVDRIMGKIIWQGMSAEQLIDSLGRPVATDRKVFKNKTSETYKYDQAGRNRYRRRVTIENGIVVGWDIK
ncbi:hypothetical protein ACYQR9_15270 [Methylobacterium sp. CM6241]